MAIRAVESAERGQRAADGAGSRGMKKDQFLGIVRHIITAAGGIVVTLGIMGDDAVSQISGAVLTLAAMGWSVWEKRGGGAA